MASGDTLVVFTALSGEQPSSAYATFDVRNSRPCLDFDDSTDEEIVFTGVLPRHYDGGGVTVRILWSSATDQTTGNCDWEAQFERIIDDTTDADADSFAAVQGVIAAAPSAVSEMVYDDIAFTDGAQIDSLAVGEAFRLKVRRDANDGTNDTMTGDAELYTVEIRET